MDAPRPKTPKADVKDNGGHVEEAKTMQVDADGIPVSFAGLTIDDVLPKLHKPWYKVPHLRKLNVVLLGALLTTATNGFDGSMMNGLQTLPVWQENFNHPSGGTLGVLNTINTIGFICALPFSGYISDKLGRRRPIQIGSIIMIIGAVLQTAAQNIGMFLAARYLLGFGLSMASVAAPALVAELSYPSQRGRVTALYNTNWFVGAIIAAWGTFGTFHIQNSWSWRIPSAIQAAPSVIQIILCFWIPESPRWLIYQDRRDEAIKVLAEYHAGGDVRSPLVLFEVAEISAALGAEKLESSGSFSEFFHTSGNRHRFFILVVLGVMQQLSGNQLISYYLHLILNQVGITDGTAQNGINGGLQIFNYITALSSAVLVDRFGRRTLLLYSLAGMFFSYLIWTILSAVNEQQQYANSGMGIGVVVSIFAFNYFYASGMTPIPFVYLSEILPFTLRAKGMMISSFCGIAMGIFNNFTTPVALEDIGWKYYIVFIVVLAVEFVLAFLWFPETKGRTLEKIAEVFDGENALVGDADKEVSHVRDEVGATKQ